MEWAPDGARCLADDAGLAHTVSRTTPAGSRHLADDAGLAHTVSRTTPAGSCHLADDAGLAHTVSRTTPAGSCHLADDAGRVLVPAQAEICRVAQLPSRRPLGERDLRDQARLGPVHAR